MDAESAIFKQVKTNTMFSTEESRMIIEAILSVGVIKERVIIDNGIVQIEIRELG
jgi:pyruvate/2-oxoglutarate dehydrogenase complex dihydrolipoamide acyltransferase (E2) component